MAIRVTMMAPQIFEGFQLMDGVILLPSLRSRAANNINFAPTQSFMGLEQTLLIALNRHSPRNVIARRNTSAATSGLIPESSTPACAWSSSGAKEKTHASEPFGDVPKTPSSCRVACGCTARYFTRIAPHFTKTVRSDVIPAGDVWGCRRV